MKHQTHRTGNPPPNRGSDHPRKFRMGSSTQGYLYLYSRLCRKAGCRSPREKRRLPGIDQDDMNAISLHRPCLHARKTHGHYNQQGANKRHRRR